MRLATPETVISVLNIMSGAGPLGVAGVALDATFPIIESHLDTVLRRRVVTDEFRLRRAERVKPTLRLSQCFVDTDESFDVAVLATTGATILDATGYKVDKDRGLVYVSATLPDSDHTLAVTYTAGFSTTGGQVAGAPDALVQAHLSLACAFYQLNPAAVPKDKAKALGRAVITGYQHAGDAQMAMYVRPRAGCLWPDATVAEDD